MNMSGASMVLFHILLLAGAVVRPTTLGRDNAIQYATSGATVLSRTEVANDGVCKKCTVIEESQANPGWWILSWGETCTPRDRAGCAECLAAPSACDNSESELWDGPCDVACCGGGGGDQLMGGGGCDEQLQVDTESPSAVLEALAKHPQSFIYNAERQALQVVACNGDVLKSVPTMDAVLRALTHAAD